MKTLALVSSYAPSLINFRGHLIRAFQQRGYRVVGFGPEDAAAALALQERGVEFIAIGPQRTSTNPLADLAYAWRLLRTFRRLRPDVVVGYTAKPVIWGSIAAFVSGTPRICAMVTGLGSVFSARSRRERVVRTILLVLYRIAMRACHCVVFQNPDDRDDFRLYGLLSPKMQIAVVHGSGVDVLQFEPTRMPSDPVFLLVARLIADKGIHEYVEAARLVRERFPNAEFRLVGWFDQNPSAIQPSQIEEWSRSGLVVYRGTVSDVRPEIAQCRVYVLPSYREGTPRTVLEAMAMARPIITTDVPGCRETVRDRENGLLVPVRDPRALADAMIELILQPALCESMGRRSRELALAKYDARAVAASTAEAIEVVTC